MAKDILVKRDEMLKTPPHVNNALNHNCADHVKLPTGEMGKDIVKFVKRDEMLPSPFMLKTRTITMTQILLHFRSGE